ncbi:hypothetical protein EJ06DRAFT_215243 [Trichodelitschia bisporula]|uniref:Uncharacterized protein n=1 Tax=Trichodelitschia bisporula TaxID=703511 RepID=A0A6G1I9K3_9PEZI|nr:hypothetical protein EJ06DRAFT_215243 [Trichodelitschia bisporula]
MLWCRPWPPCSAHFPPTPPSSLSQHACRRDTQTLPHRTTPPQLHRDARNTSTHIAHDYFLSIPQLVILTSPLSTEPFVPAPPPRGRNSIIHRRRHSTPCPNPTGCLAGNTATISRTTDCQNQAHPALPPRISVKKVASQPCAADLLRASHAAEVGPLISLSRCLSCRPRNGGPIMGAGYEGGDEEMENDEEKAGQIACTCSAMLEFARARRGSRGYPDTTGTIIRRTNCLAVPLPRAPAYLVRVE